MDAYAPEERAALRSAGGTEAGRLYERVLKRLAPDASITIVYPADADAELPSAEALRDYRGVAWTGSSLTIHDDDDPRVRRQIAFAHRVYEVGVPSFGSCWAAQLAVVAAGGRARASPRGREFGIARGIRLGPEGRSHPLYSGKPAQFDAFTSHQDEVTGLGPRATPLASNPWSAIQAVSVEHARGRFWAVQYHPEYDLHEVASLCRLRRDELVAQGSFSDRSAADAYAEQLEALHRDPTRSDLARCLGVGSDLLDEDLRTLEVRNWLRSLDREEGEAGDAASRERC